MQQLFIALGIFSAVTFVLSLLLLPWLVGRIPTGYFARTADDHNWRMLLQTRTLLRNVLGFPILLAGIAMLILPGQGIITILMGLGIMQFPGKFSLEKWLVTRPGVLSTLNWIRKKSGHPELQVR